MYIDGEGVPQDKAQGLAWIVRAADADNVAAQFTAGQLLVEDENAPADIQKGADYVLKSAHAGHPKAALLMAQLYNAGKGAEKNDLEQGIQKLRGAIQQLNKEGKARLDEAGDADHVREAGVGGLGDDDKRLFRRLLFLRLRPVLEPVVAGAKDDENHRSERRLEVFGEIHRRIIPDLKSQEAGRRKRPRWWAPAYGRCVPRGAETHSSLKSTCRATPFTSMP